MKRLLQSAVLVLAVCTAHAQSSTEAIQNYSGAFLGTFPGTMGWTFQPVNNINLVSLGCFDTVVSEYGVIAVGLWNSGGTLLASNAITTSSIRINVSRYESITPVQLLAGQTYYVGAYFTGDSMNIGIVDTGPGGGGSVTSAAGIQVGSVFTSSSGFGFPGTPIGVTGVTLGPNFRFSSVPEPSSLALLGLGGLGLAAWRARRR